MCTSACMVIADDTFASSHPITLYHMIPACMLKFTSHLVSTMKNFVHLQKYTVKTWHGI